MFLSIINQPFQRLMFEYVYLKALRKKVVAELQFDTLSTSKKVSKLIY